MRSRDHLTLAAVALGAWLVPTKSARAQLDTTIGVITRDVAVPMRDGTLLRADVWRPTISGKYPALVYRTPYNKAGVFTTYSLFRAAVSRGYAVVAQDVRGRYASAGEYLAYQQEGRDGYDTIEWAAVQPWSDGRIGTFGLSYPGAVQWLAAVEQPPHLLAMVPAMTFATPRHFWYVGGVWDNSWISWVWHNIAPDLRARRGLQGPRTNRDAAAAWPNEGRVLQTSLPLAAMSAFRGVADWYYEWMRHGPFDPWWDWADLTTKYDRVTAAVLNLSGWHDEAYGPAGATMNFAGLVKARGGDARAARTHLVVGPWNHGIGPIARTRIGDRDMGAAAALDYDELVLRWMDRWVKGLRNGVDGEPPVRVYAMGANAWRTGDRWPLSGERVTLYATVPAAPGKRAGQLGWHNAPRHDSSSFLSNPDDPVRDPHAETPGPHDYRSLGARPDVVIFETDPLASDVEIVGPITARVYLSVDGRDTDVWVKLLDVAPDGTAFNLMSPGLDVLRASYRDGSATRALLEPGRIYALDVPTLLTSNRFLRGHRIRVAIMASFAPHMSRNLHTGALEMDSSRAIRTRVTVHHGGAYPSRIELTSLAPRSAEQR
jgi:putative CocE/NonD family hydrolase